MLIGWMDSPENCYCCLIWLCLGRSRKEHTQSRHLNHHVHWNVEIQRSTFSPSNGWKKFSPHIQHICLIGNVLLNHLFKCYQDWSLIRLSRVSFWTLFSFSVFLHFHLPISVSVCECTRGHIHNVSEKRLLIDWSIFRWLTIRTGLSSSGNCN